eukprot:5672500-Pyramimonas_sp.AAC.1
MRPAPRPSRAPTGRSPSACPLSKQPPSNHRARMASRLPGRCRTSCAPVRVFNIGGPRVVDAIASVGKFAIGVAQD